MMKKVLIYILSLKIFNPIYKRYLINNVKLELVNITNMLIYRMVVSRVQFHTKNKYIKYRFSDWDLYSLLLSNPFYGIDWISYDEKGDIVKNIIEEHHYLDNENIIMNIHNFNDINLDDKDIDGIIKHIKNNINKAIKLLIESDINNIEEFIYEL